MTNPTKSSVADKLFECVRPFWGVGTERVKVSIKSLESIILFAFTISCEKLIALLSNLVLVFQKFLLSKS